jgi:hypothetical protein
MLRLCGVISISSFAIHTSSQPQSQPEWFDFNIRFGFSWFFIHKSLFPYSLGFWFSPYTLNPLTVKTVT